MLKKKRHKSKSKRTYELVAFPLPQPPQVPNLPPQLFFYLDNRFSREAKNRIRVLILLNIANWQQHYVQKAASGVSQLATCTGTYAERGLNPVWFKGIPFTNGMDALNYAMDVLTFRFRENGFRKKKSFIKYHVPPKGKQSTIFTRTSKKIKCVSLSVIANPRAINDLTIPNSALTGSLYHAWLHRCGYTHPKNRYTGFLVAEAPMCIMRGFQDKTPGVPDSRLTRFFD